MTWLIIFLASDLVYFFLLTIVFCLWKKDWRGLLQVLLSISLAALLEKFIKLLFPLPRPFEIEGITPLVSSAGSSFPSGHVMFAFAIATSLFLSSRRKRSRRELYLAALFFILAALVGLGRVLAKVHFWRDIAGGAALGTIIAVLVEKAGEKMVKLQADK